MKLQVLIAAICTLLSQQALAAKMQDYSLSPEETVRQPDIMRSNNRFDPYASQYGTGNTIDTPNRPITGLPDPSANTRKGFMDIYCDTQITPPLLDTPKLAGMQECLKNERLQICDLYIRAPREAQEVISDAAECYSQASQAESPNANCSVHHTARLKMIQKSWQDQNTVWSLVFIPEHAAFGTGGKCLPGAQP